MRVLVLSGTGWLSGQLATEALRAGHEVVCLARGHSGQPATGAAFLPADRSTPGAYEALAGERWDVTFDVARQPGQVREAAAALVERTTLYAFVSSISVYAEHTELGLDEDAPLLGALEGDVMPSLEHYGEAKVACEHHVLSAFGLDRSLIARPGLIAGPGDVSDRTGYWPYRFAHPAAPEGRVLVPDAPGEWAQVIDVRDLAKWLLAAACDGVCGIYNAVGPAVPLADHLEAARSVAGHTGQTVVASPDWLRAHDVQPWAGPRSLPLWTGDPELAGHGAHTGTRATAAGLVFRSLEQTLADTLVWERGRMQPQPRAAGLADGEERELLEAFVGSERSGM